MWPVNHTAATFLTLDLEAFPMSGHGDLEMYSPKYIVWSAGE